MIIISTIATLPSDLCEWFSDMIAFSDCKFCTEFPSVVKQTPVTQPVVVFGTTGTSVLKNTTDDTGNIITNSRVTNTTYKIGIHAPRNSGGTTCYSVLDRILDQLLFNTNLSISEVSSSDITYIRNTDSLYMYAAFTVSGIMNKGTNYVTGFTA